MTLLMGLIEDGALQVSTIFERAIVCTSNNELEVKSIAGSDFNDLSDAKLITTGLKKKKLYSKKMKGAHFKFRNYASVDANNKTGGLRIQTMECITKKPYWFCIPRSEYSLSLIHI